MVSSAAEKREKGFSFERNFEKMGKNEKNIGIV
jgi:hypothetical protein